MTKISASLVKQLRERSGAGMMDAKNALVETAGDMEAAIDWLRKKGLAQAAKKAERAAADGLIGMALGDGEAALVEVNAETDFVARNPQFQDFVTTLASMALKVADLDALKVAPYPGTDRSVAEELTQRIATIGENMSLRRLSKLAVTKGQVGGYLHNAVSDGVGRLGVLVALESEADASILGDVVRKVAMHAAAFNPAAASIDALDPALVAREREVLVEQARSSGKPEAVIEKMIEGRLRKFYQEVVLSEQAFAMDPDRSVAQFIADAAKEAGTPIKLAGFVRLALGEGVEKREENFADEVAKTRAGK
jgi:elongation factor Ts